MNEDSDEDDDYNETPQMEMRKTKLRKRPREEDFRIRKEDSRDEIRDKFTSLKEALNEMKGYRRNICFY